MLRGLLALQGCKIGRRHVKTLMWRMGICEQTKNISAGTKEKLAMCFSTLSTCLSSGGKHEAAASAVSRSVAICRELAKENPDKFGPNLTLTLNNMAEGLAMSESSSNVGRLEEAEKTAVEALQLMMPYFFERPPVFATRIATILKNYRRYARSLDRKPDERLVSPVVEVLHQLGVLID
jgi:hypothetical protein